jgi:SAM-dependent methyltransferase
MIKSAKRPSETENQLAGMLTNFNIRAEQIRNEIPLSPRAMDVFNRAVQQINRRKVAILQRFVRRNHDIFLDEPSVKYLDLPLYLARKANWIVELNLDRSPPKSILDLGIGGGHFPFLASLYHHHAVGIDMYDDLYSRILAVYSIPRIIHTITPGIALPVVGKFDLVTAFQVTFNRPVGRPARGRLSNYWTFDEWNWFIEQLCSLINFPGKIFLELNRQPMPDSAKDHALDLIALFKSNDAIVSRRNHTVLFKVDRPFRLMRPPESRLGFLSKRSSSSLEPV